MARHHFLLFSGSPLPGNVHPALQLANCIVRTGAAVTFVTSISARGRMGDVSLPEGLSLTTFSDGYDDGFKQNVDIGSYAAELDRCASPAIAKVIERGNADGRPITCLVCTILLPRVGKVAREHHVPIALLSVQAAAVLGINYHYLNGYRDAITNIWPTGSVELPGLPLTFTNRDIPSVLNPSDPFRYLLQKLQEQLQALEEQDCPTVLVNSFDALEPEAMKAIERYRLFPIGPLVRSKPSDLKGSSNSSTEGHIQWLDSQAEASVVYISFGSVMVLGRRQKLEVARALLDLGRPFLWVIRPRGDGPLKEEEEGEEDTSLTEEVEKKLGMVVPWCSQVEVLSHPAVGCFVTHCGWNSTLESMVYGVPVVAFPRGLDQMTNAKLIEDMWKTGVRVMANEEGLVERNEIVRCLEIVLGRKERGEEIMRNVIKWKELAREAVAEGGSSEKNLMSFLNAVAEE